jgi:tetratricopeptide (TPR) repeat protein
VLGRIGREDIAIVLANAAPDAEGKSHSLGTLALALAQRNSPDSARRAADASLAASQHLTDEDPDKAMWLAATAKTLNTLGKNTEAMPFANHALSLVGRWTGDDSQINTNRVVVAETLSELGDNTKALGVVDTIRDNQRKAEALIAIIRSRTATAEECNNIANQVAGYIDKLKAASKPKLLGSMARSLAIARLDEDAIRLAHLAISSAGELEEHDSGTSEGVCDAAYAFILTGRFDEARQAIDKIKIDVYLDNARGINLRIRVLNALATALENAGQHERASDTIHLAQEMLAINRKDSYDIYTFDADTLIDLAKTLSHLGNADDATQANQRALKLSLQRLKERGA